jgi:hypothetical protein
MSPFGGFDRRVSDGSGTASSFAARPDTTGVSSALRIFTSFGSPR